MAFGVDENGHRTVLGLSVSLSEAEVHWRDFFAHLQQRGLAGVRKRPVWLSITHKSSSQLEPKLNIGQSGESTPHDGIAGWRIVPSCEITAQPRDLGEVSRELRIFPCGRFG